GMSRREFNMPGTRPPVATSMPVMPIPRPPPTPTGTTALSASLPPSRKGRRSRLGYLVIGAVLGAVGLVAVGYRFVESQSAVALPVPQTVASARPDPAPPPPAADPEQAATPDPPADSAPPTATASAAASAPAVVPT